MTGEPTLVAQVVSSVALADAVGEPITYMTGPLADRRAKRALAFSGVHQSRVCAAIRDSVDAGLIRVQQIGTATALMGERTKQYPVVTLVPATS